MYKNPNRFRTQRLRRVEPEKQLVFAPLAWLKLLYFLHAGNTEVGGFGLSSPDDPLYVQDLLTVTQSVTAVHVAFEDEAVADHFDRCLDQGVQPARCGRIWCHTHPGTSPQPSIVDEETFSRVFGACDWAIMFILSRSQRTYARLSFGAGPGGQMELGVAVDWGRWPQYVNQQEQHPEAPWWSTLQEWASEYVQNIHPQPMLGGLEAMCLDDFQEGWDLQAGLSPMQRAALEALA